MPPVRGRGFAAGLFLLCFCTAGQALTVDLVYRPPPDSLPRIPATVRVTDAREEEAEIGVVKDRLGGDKDFITSFTPPAKWMCQAFQEEWGGNCRTGGAGPDSAPSPGDTSLQMQVTIRQVHCVSYSLFQARLLTEVAVSRGALILFIRPLEGYAITADRGGGAGPQVQGVLNAALADLMAQIKDSVRLHTRPAAPPPAPTPGLVYYPSGRGRTDSLAGSEIQMEKKRFRLLSGSLDEKKLAKTLQEVEPLLNRLFTFRYLEDFSVGQPRYVFLVTVNPEGWVERARVVGAGKRDFAFERCLCRELQRLSFARGPEAAYANFLYQVQLEKTAIFGH